MLRAGHVIALCVLALLTLGVVMISSSRMAVADRLGNPLPPVTFESIAVSRPVAHLGLALAALGIGAAMPVRALAGRASGAGTLSDGGARRTLMIGSGLLVAVLCLVYVPGLGDTKLGALRWLNLPIPGLGDGLSVQPSEIAKWGMVFVLAAYAARNARRMPEFWAGLIPGLGAVAIVAGIIVLEDLGTGVLIAAASAVVLLAGGARLAHLLLLAPAAIAAFVAAVIASPYRIARITASLDPFADAERTGYHAIQSMSAVAGGEVFGRGLGHGQQKFGYLPEADSDFLFAIVCEELGLAGALAVAGLFTLLLWSGAAIVQRERDPFLKLGALGVLVTLGLQAAINMAVVTGLGPTKGIALPLMSSGGTGWIMTAFCAGLLLAIDRTQEKGAGADASASLGAPAGA